MSPVTVTGLSFPVAGASACSQMGTTHTEPFVVRGFQAPISSLSPISGCPSGRFAVSEASPHPFSSFYLSPFLVSPPPHPPSLLPCYSAADRSAHLSLSVNHRHRCREHRRALFLSLLHSLLNRSLHHHATTHSLLRSSTPLPPSPSADLLLLLCGLGSTPHASDVVATFRVASTTICAHRSALVRLVIHPSTHPPVHPLTASFIDLLHNLTCVQSHSSGRRPSASHRHFPTLPHLNRLAGLPLLHQLSPSATSLPDSIPNPGLLTFAADT